MIQAQINEIARIVVAMDSVQVGSVTSEVLKDMIERDYEVEPDSADEEQILSNIRHRLWAIQEPLRH